MKQNKNFNFLEDNEIIEFTNEMEKRFLDKDFLPIPNIARKVVEAVFEKVHKRGSESISQSIDWYKGYYGEEIVVDALYQIKKYANKNVHYNSNSEKLNFTNMLWILKSTSIFLQDAYLDKPQYDFSETPYVEKNEQESYVKVEKSINSNELTIKKTSLIDLLLDRRVLFEIPFYQRRYTWKKSQLLTLHEDIMARIKDRNHHYFGVFAIKKADLYNKKQFKLKIIDGQQRLTTSLLLLKAAYNSIINRKLPKVSILFELFENEIKWSDRYINSSIDKNKFYEFKRILDKSYFSDYEWGYSENFKYFYDIFNEFNRDEIYDYVSTFASKFEIAQIEYDVLSNREMDIFENMNSKGTELEEWDLIKNHIFNLIDIEGMEDNEKVKIIDKSFLHNFVSNFPKDKSESELADFFIEYIYLINSKKGVEYKKFDRFIVYKNFKENFNDTITTREEYLQMLSSFSSFGLIYKALINSEYTMIDKKLQSISLKLKNITPRKTTYFIIFKLIEKYGEWDGERWTIHDWDNLSRFIELLDKVLMRLLVARSYTAKIRTFGAQIIKLLNRDWSEMYLERDFKRLVRNSEAIHVTDLEFENAIISGGIKTGLAQKLLIQVEQYLTSKNDLKQIGFERYSVEKVMPSDHEKWKDILKAQSWNYIEQHKKHVNLLGNFYLLPKKMKAIDRSQPFETKKTKLLVFNTALMQGDSSLGLKPLTDVRNWTFEEIAKRNKAITKILCRKIYNIDS